MKPALPLLLTAALAGAALVAALSALPAQAHPHVWVTTKAEIAYGEGGRVTGVRHAWTFDASYSAFVTQGLDKNNDGKLTPDELAGLAAENTANLAEFAYFTKMKVGGKEQAFTDPVEPRMAMEGDKLTLSFLLPLKSPVAQGRGVTSRMRTSSTSPGSAPRTATGPVQICTPSPPPSPVPAPRRMTPFWSLVQRKTLSAPGSPFTMRSASSLA